MIPPKRFDIFPPDLGDAQKEKIRSEEHLKSSNESMKKKKNEKKKKRQKGRPYKKAGGAVFFLHYVEDIYLVILLVSPQTPNPNPMTLYDVSINTTV